MTACPLCTEGWQRILLPSDAATDAVLAACTCDAGLRRAAQGVAPAWAVLDRHPRARAAHGQSRPPGRYLARHLDGWRDVCRVRGIPVPAWIERAEVIPSAALPAPTPIVNTISTFDVRRYNDAAIAARAVYVYPDDATDLDLDVADADSE